MSPTFQVLQHPSVVTREEEEKAVIAPVPLHSARICMSRFRTLLARRSPAAFARDERGAAMVEFSVIAFLLLVMVFGMIDYGRYFLIRADLTNAVREGARYGATLSESGANTTLIQNYTSSRVQVASAPTPTVGYYGTVMNNDRRVRVSINGYQFNPATFLVIKSAKTINVQAEFRKEQQ
jgi:Flp pilus assembly protein TadG